MSQQADFEFDLSEQFPHLPQAPIAEAVIHWRARADRALEPEAFRATLQKKLPDYPHCRPQRALKFETQVAAEGSATQMQDTWMGYRLESEDGRNVAQFSRDGLVFSRLQPYETWERFQAEAMRLWRIYVELAQPSEVQRLGVRFINRIAPVELSRLGEYLAHPPERLDVALSMPHREFFRQNMYDIPGHPLGINVVEAIQPPVPPQREGFGLILDIDVSSTKALSLDGETLQQRLAEMRWLKNKVFFSSLTPDRVDVFREPA